MLNPLRQQFEIHVETDGPSAILRVGGEMDLAGEDGFTSVVDACLAQGATELRVDLSNLAFIDSSGLRLLIDLWERSCREAIELSIVQGTGQVRRTLEIAGADRLLPIVDRGSSR